MATLPQYCHIVHQYWHQYGQISAHSNTPLKLTSVSQETTCTPNGNLSFHQHTLVVQPTLLTSTHKTWNIKHTHHLDVKHKTSNIKHTQHLDVKRNTDQPHLNSCRCGGGDCKQTPSSYHQRAAALSKDQLHCHECLHSWCAIRS